MAEFKFYETADEKIAELITPGQTVNDVDDALDVIANADYLGCRMIIIHESQLHPDFFILRTGVAGEILQKFSTYRMKLAIVGDFTNCKSKSLRDFIRESNKQRQINFVNSVDDAIH